MPSSTQEANSEKHYTFLIFAVFVGLIGVYVRFADWSHGTHDYASWLGNILMGLGSILILRAVFKILD